MSCRGAAIAQHVVTCFYATCSWLARTHLYSGLLGLGMSGSSISREYIPVAHQEALAVSSNVSSNVALPPSTVALVSSAASSATPLMTHPLCLVLSASMPNLLESSALPKLLRPYSSSWSIFKHRAYGKQLHCAACTSLLIIPPHTNIPPTDVLHSKMLLLAKKHLWALQSVISIFGSSAMVSILNQEAPCDLHTSTAQQQRRGSIMLCCLEADSVPSRT